MRRLPSDCKEEENPHRQRRHGELAKALYGEQHGRREQHEQYRRPRIDPAADATDSAAQAEPDSPQAHRDRPCPALGSLTRSRHLVSVSLRVRSVKESWTYSFAGAGR